MLHVDPSGANPERTAAPLTFLVHLDCLVSIADEGPLSPWMVADRPGAPKQAQVSADGAMLTAVAFPFADMLLAFLQGLSGTVELFSFWAPAVAASVANAMHWGRFPLTVANRGPSVVPVSLATLRKPYEAVATTVVVDHLFAAKHGWHQLLASNILTVHHHGVFHSREELSQYRCKHAARHDAATASHPLHLMDGTVDPELGQGHLVSGGSTVVGVGHSANSILRRALRSLALLPVMQQALRLFEVYVSGATRPTVQACVLWIESNLFDGRVFAIDTTGTVGGAHNGNSRRRYRRGSEREAITAEGMAAAVLIGRYGGTIAPLAHTGGDGADANAMHVDVVVSMPSRLAASTDDSTSSSDDETMQPRTTVVGDAIHASSAPQSRHLPSIPDDEEAPPQPKNAQHTATPAMVVDVAWVDACIRCWTILPNHSITAFVEDDMSDVDDVQQYVVAHLMLLLSPPPLAAAAMDVATLFGVLERCGVSRAPLEDASFLAMMSTELELEYAAPETAASRLGDDASEDEQAFRVDPTVTRRTEATRSLVAFRSRRGRFTTASALYGVVGESARHRAHALRRTLGNELVDVLRRPQTSDVGTQCWVVHRASIATMTSAIGGLEGIAAGPPSVGAVPSQVVKAPVLSLEDLRAMAQQQQQQQTSASPTQPLQPPAPVGAPSPTAAAVHHPTSTASPSTIPPQPSTVGPSMPDTGPQAVAAFAEATQPTATTTPRPSVAATIPTTDRHRHAMEAHNICAAAPALLPPPPYPHAVVSAPPLTGAAHSGVQPASVATTSEHDPAAYLFAGMVPGYSSATHRVTGAVLADAMHCDLPLYAYGIDVDRVGNTLKAFKALFSCDKKLLDGAMFTVRDAPASVLVRDSNATTGRASSCLRVTFRTQMDATNFIAKNRPHVALTVKGGIRVLLLPEGLELTRSAPPPPPSPPVGQTTRGRESSTGRSRRRSRSRKTSRSVSRGRRRSRSKSPRAPVRKHPRGERIPSVAAESPMFGPTPPDVAAANGLPFDVALTPTEVETLHRIGSTPQQVVVSPANVEFFAFESLHGHDVAQRTILMCVAKARRYLEALPSSVGQVPPTARPRR